MENIDDLNFLFEKFLSGTFTETELKELLGYFERSSHETYLKTLLEKALSADINTANEVKLQGMINLLDQNIQRELDNRRSKNKHIVTLKMVKWLSVAAAVVLFFTGAMIFYLNQRNVDHKAHFTLNDIGPGKVGAILTLGNGKEIRLSKAQNGKLTEESGITVSKLADGQLVYEIKNNKDHFDKINTLVTAKGETYILNLPDKTKVWINSDSKLTYYPKLLVKGVRTVKLEGEAYFEVTKDKKHPFIVECNDQKLNVLGTHFNVNSYTGERTKTTLLEGSVSITPSSTNTKSNTIKSKILKPNQQATIINGGASIKTVDTDLAVAWKNNEFMFEKENIEGIMKMIERWYDVKIIYEGKQSTQTYSGSVSRFENVSNVLRILESSGKVHFRIKGRIIFVTN